MSEENNLFIYVREDNGDRSSSIEKYPIVPFFSLVPLSKNFHWQTNDTCQTDIFWQAYFNLATKHDIPINWDGTQSSELQSLETYNKLKNVISDRDNEGKLKLKDHTFSANFLEYTPSFHRTIVNFIGQNDWDTFGLTDEPYDVNLTTEFIKDTGYDVEQLVAEKKIFHNEQLGDNTYVWFDKSWDNLDTPSAIDNLTKCFFVKKLNYIKDALKNIILTTDENDMLNFSKADNRNNIKSALEKANYIFESFDRIFDDYDDRIIKDLRSDYSADEHKNFIHDFAEYLTFQSFCGNYMKLNTFHDSQYNPCVISGINQLYLLQLIFTQIMLDHIDKPSEIRKQIFDSAVKVRDYFLKYEGYDKVNALRVEIQKKYSGKVVTKYCGPQKDEYEYFSALFCQTD